MDGAAGKAHDDDFPALAQPVHHQLIETLSRAQMIHQVEPVLRVRVQVRQIQSNQVPRRFVLQLSIVAIGFNDDALGIATENP